MTKQTTTPHVLSEIAPEILNVGNSKKDHRTVKAILNQQILITGVKALGMNNEAYAVSAALASEPDKEFTVSVSGQQPRAVLASIVENSLLPMSCKFSRLHGHYALIE